MSDVVVIYHAGCWDGFCAAWIAHHYYPDAEFVPAQYDSNPKLPDVVGKDVFILDFCYSAEVTVEIISKAKSVVILDHHKTAKAELTKLDSMTLPLGANIATVFDMEKSGGRLAQEFFHFGPSWLVDYTEDRDLWRHKLPETHEVNAYIRSWPLNFDMWDVWHNYTDPMLSVASVGAGILRAKQQIVDFHVSKAYEHEIAGHLIPVVNATCYASEIAGELAKGKPFAAVYFIQQNQRVWSLRSDENGLDVSEIARQFGGGGHRGAAGFQEKIS